MADNVFRSDESIATANVKDFTTETITATGDDMPVCKIHTGATGIDSGPVTTDNPLPVVLSADDRAALENITVVVSGGVELGSTSLAALETVTVAGTVDLGALSLAALENITVGGTVELGAPSLAALENITVGGTVELGAPSLAALENITASIDQSAIIGSLTDAQATSTTSGSVISYLKALFTFTGGLTETAPASDTASSGLNGRLQRIAQLLTLLKAQIPASLGIKTAANSLSITPASDSVFGAAEISKSPTAGAGQQLAVGATSVASTAITATCLEITATTPCWVEFGATPTATKPTSYPILTAGLPYRFAFTSGQKIAVIQDSTAGFIYINPVA